MAHPQQQFFVQSIKKEFPQFFQSARVFELGSLDINGSVRSHFSRCDYIGVDVGPGPGVDVVCEGQSYDAPDNGFDVSISCEAMEHNPFWKESFLNMVRVCREGGLVLMTCASTGRTEHGTRRTTPQFAPLITWEYYKNLDEEDFRKELELNDFFTKWMFCVDFSSNDLYFVGFKIGAPSPANVDVFFQSLRRFYRWKNWSNLKAIRFRIIHGALGDGAYQESCVRVQTEARVWLGETHGD